MSMIQKRWKGRGWRDERKEDYWGLAVHFEEACWSLPLILWSLKSIYREDYSIVWLINMLCPLWVCVVAATLSVHLV